MKLVVIRDTYVWPELVYLKFPSYRNGNSSNKMTTSMFKRLFGFVPKQGVTNIEFKKPEVRKIEHIKE